MQQDYGSVPQIDERNGLASTSGNKSSNNELHRHLSLFDLVCVGVGATGELIGASQLNKSPNFTYCSYYYYRHTFKCQSAAACLF